MRDRFAPRPCTGYLAAAHVPAWLADKGRAINSNDPSWPSTLTGIARQFYDVFKRELEPQGYRLRCQIISFPDGMLGDVGVYLDW